MKHTKEPWGVVSDLPVYGIYSESEDRHIVQTINQNNYKTHAKSKENIGIQNFEDAERIVACVNACEGITTEALKKGIVSDSVGLHKTILKRKTSSFHEEYGVQVFEEEVG